MKDFCNFYYMKRRRQQSQCCNLCSVNCAKRFQEPYIIEQDYQAFIKWQKQPSRGSLWKMCSENMQQMYRRTPTWKCDFNEVVLQHIYRRTSMRKCDFNKVAVQRYWNHTSAWVFSCKFSAYFQNSLFLGKPLKGCFWNELDCF